MNIWENYKFTIKTGKSAKEYLQEQSSDLVAKTSGLLRQEIELKGSFGSLSYDLCVVSDILNGYKRHVLTVTEESESERFPVTMHSPLCGVTFSHIKEDDFLNKVEQMLNVVKGPIVDLYHQTRGHAESMRSKLNNYEISAEHRLHAFNKLDSLIHLVECTEKDVLEYPKEISKVSHLKQYYTHLNSLFLNVLLNGLDDYDVKPEVVLQRCTECRKIIHDFLSQKLSTLVEENYDFSRRK